VYHYSDTTAISYASTTEHFVFVTSLQASTTYFFRPVSANNRDERIGDELTITTPKSGSTFPVPSLVFSGSCNEYITSYLAASFNNNFDQVIRLQVFLKNREGADVDINGIMDNKTVNAVNMFQLKYKDEILTPWGISIPTGYVYYTTSKKINELNCGDSQKFELTVAQVNEIQLSKEASDRRIQEGLNNGQNREDIEREIINEQIIGLGEPSEEVQATSSTSTDTEVKSTNNLAAAIRAVPEAVYKGVNRILKFFGLRK
jgi:hypothetical protein